MTHHYNAAMLALDMPARIRALPISPEGYPTPWFVATLPDGRRDFRFADQGKRVAAVKRRLCWVCGGTLGRHLAFVIGPMCAVNRTTAEPACHLDCAKFTVRGCPFLTRPRMRRNEKDLAEIGASEMPGLAIKRNPGATCIWVCDSYHTFPAGNGWLIRIGDPTKLFWYAEGREATHDEIKHSVDTGLPLLEAEARKEGAPALAALDKQMNDFWKLLAA